MNSLTSKPTKFNVVAQNMLGSAQNSQHKLMNVPYYFGMSPGRVNEQLSNSMVHQSDRNNNQPGGLFRMDHRNPIRERSNSNYRTRSIENSSMMESSPHAYNIRGRLLQLNDNPQKLQEKEKQKQELKDYLQRQIDDKQRIRDQKIQRDKAEEEKAEQRYLQQLQDIRQRLSKERDNKEPDQAHVQQVQQAQKLQNYITPIGRNIQDGPFINMYRNQSQENDIMQRLNNVQNDLQLMQTAKNISNVNMGDIRNQIKSMIHKQQTHRAPQEQPLETETKFIPIEIDINQTQGRMEQQQQQQQQQLQANRNILIQENETRKVTTAQSMVASTSKPKLKSQASFHSIQNKSIHQVSQLLPNNSHLTISQLTQRDRSHSKDRRLSRESRIGSVERVNRLHKEEEEKKLKLLQLKQPQIQHRTTTLMQIPLKNKPKQEDGKFHKIL